MQHTLSQDDEKNIDDKCVQDCLSYVWRKVQQGYADNGIFSVSADEAGFFLKLTPSKTLSFKSMKFSDGKLSKQKTIFLVCGNLIGTEKKKS